MNSITILGAGPAGLAAAFYLRRLGHEVTLLEAQDEPGGYARTFVKGPFRYDTGAHRFHDKDEEITRDVLDLMGDEMLKVHSPSQICWRGKFLDFPLAPGNLIRKIGMKTLLRASVDLLRARLKSTDHGEDFAAYANHRYGETIAQAFLIGYSEKLWGLPASKLAAEVSGGRLKGLSARTALYELLRGRESKVEHLDGSFYYPRRGYGKIAERLAVQIGRENIRTFCKITKLKHDGSKILAVELDGGETLNPSRVINSLPPLTTLNLLDPAPPVELVRKTETLKFRDLILVALMMDRPRVTRNASIYFPSPDIPFTRLYEPKNRSIELAPPRQTCVVVEMPCFESDPLWREPDAALTEKAVAQLESLKLIERKDLLESHVHRLRAAYPILEVGRLEVVDEILSWLHRFGNLFTVGRAGRFEYTHVHDLMRQGKELARAISAQQTASSAAAVDSV